jgi:hypothetical protein
MARSEPRELAEQLLFALCQKLPGVKAALGGLDEKALQALNDRLRHALAAVDRALATRGKG